MAATTSRLASRRPAGFLGGGAAKFSPFFFFFSFFWLLCRDLDGKKDCLEKECGCRRNERLARLPAMTSADMPVPRASDDGNSFLRANRMKNRFSRTAATHSNMSHGYNFIRELAAQEQERLSPCHYRCRCRCRWLDGVIGAVFAIPAATATALTMTMTMATNERLLPTSQFI